MIIINLLKKSTDINKNPTNKIDVICHNHDPIIKCNTRLCKNNAKYYIECELYCSECANENEYEEMRLLILNSP
jgi:hypothetical protein